MGFSRQECWSGLAFPSGDLPDPEIKPVSFALAGRFFFLKINQFILLYNIVLVFSYIDLNPPWVYMCSPSWTPSHSLPHTIPLGHPSARARAFFHTRISISFYISSVQSLSCIWLFLTPWNAACQASLSITSSRSSLKLMSIESVIPSNHLILCHPLLLCLQSSPASESLKWVNSSYQVAKVLEFQLQHQSFQWICRSDFFLGWTGWISLQSKGPSRVFSNTTVQKHQFFGTQLSLYMKEVSWNQELPFWKGSCFINSR